MKKLLWLFLLPLSLAAQTVSVNSGTTYQTINGWGASTGYNERNNNFTAGVADCFFSTSNGSCPSGNSIGLSWVKIQDNATSGSAPDLATVQLAVARGAKFFIGFNPPSGLNSGNYASQASYMVGKIQFFQNSPNNVPVSAIAPINEPLNTTTTAAEIDTFIASYLYPAMVTAGLSSISIVAPDGGYWFRDDYITACMNDSNCATHVPIVSGHAYWTGVGNQGQDGFTNGYNCCADYTQSSTNPPSSTAGKILWQTEVNGAAQAAGACPDDTDIGAYDGSMSPDALTYAHNIHDFLTLLNGSAWFYWNLAGQTADGTPVPGCNDGLTQETTTNPVSSIIPAKRFYAIGNFSKFIRPGQVRIFATPNPRTSVYMTAFLDQTTGAFEIVGINQTSSSVSQPFTLTGLSATSVTPYLTSATSNLAAQSPITISGNAFTATLPADSVTTFVSSPSPILTINLSGSGSGTYSGTNCAPGGYTSGTPISCSFTPTGGSSLASVVGTGSASGCSTSSCSFNITASSTINLTFNAGTVINVPDCVQADVQAAFNSVTASTVQINLPACTATWNSTVTLSVPSGSTGLTLAGATACTGAGNPNGSTSGVVTCIDNTLITDGMSYTSGDPPFLSINTRAGVPFRMTGMSITGNGTTQTYNGAIAMNGASQLTRVDHSHIFNLQSLPINNGGSVAGVYDHNLISQSTPSLVFHISGATSSDQWGAVPWSQPTNLGASNFVFFEDNEIIGGGDDCDRGGRFVIRYNNFVSVAGQGEFLLTHPTGEPGGPLRGCRAWEVYGNKFSSATNMFGIWFLDAGTGVNWGNATTTEINFFFSLISMRTNNNTYTQTATPGGWGYCGTAFNGTGSAWDGSASTTSGYPCIDQLGRGQGQLLTGNFPTVINSVTGTIAWPNQALEPMYEWLDTYPAGTFVNNAYTSVMAQNRDYYLYCGAGSPSGCTTFNGTVGVGSGVLASRPSTCTAGVGYWATDQGGWNQSGIGGQGQLYKCTATNTWTLAYTPYTYPNPLTGSAPQAATPSPSVPPGTYGPFTLTFTDATPGASMFCTTNGIMPTPSSPAYAPFVVTSTQPIQCIATASGYTTSNVGGGLYTVFSGPTNVQGVIMKGVSIR